MPARPYIVRFSILRRLFCPSTGPVVQGSFAGRDIHAGQQHIPLAGLAISTIWER